MSSSSSKQAKVRVGLFAAAAITLVVIVLATFAGVNLFSHKNHFKIVFEDTVYGLEKGSLVYFNGIKVGSVSDIAIDPGDLKKIVVEIKVGDDAPVHTDTGAELTMSGITGLKVVDLRGGTPTKPLLEDGGTIPVKPGMLDKLSKTAESLVDRTDELMAKVSKLVDKSTKVAENLDQSTAALTGLITENKDALHHTITTIDSTVNNLGGQVNELVASAKTVMTSANTVMTTANTTITDVHGFVDGANSLVGDVGRIIKTNENQLAGTMADLRQASRSFKDLARELRDKPSRVIFSASGSDRKLP